MYLLKNSIFTIIVFLSLLIPIQLIAQDSTKKQNPLIISGYAEVYYRYDFNKPVNNSMPHFIYSHNRTNEVNLNFGFLKGAYNSDWVRANLSFAAGTYMTANYASEPDGIKNIYEANIGVRIFKKNNLWLDAGIMPSHIGWEGAVSKDDWTLTRSVAADNSPYFESGVKIGYTSKNEKLYLSALILNGWQRIHRVDGNSTPAFGTQIIYKPSSKIIINSSTFSGNDKPDSVKQMRYFHDFYSIIQITEQFGITFGFDIGWEKRLHTNKWNNWFTPNLILRYTPGSKWAIAGRVEYFNDEKQVIIYTGTSNGCHLYGASLNVDKLIRNNVLWRNEFKTLNNKNAIFQKGNELVKSEVSITTSFAITF